MSTITKTQAALFTVFAGIVAVQADCGPSVHVMEQFELPECPDVTFSLPDTVNRPPYRLHDVGHEYPEYYRGCSGFAFYHLLENGDERFYYRVKLNRGPSCSLSIGYSYQSGGTEYDQRTKEQFTPWVEVVAKLVMQGSDVEPRVPAARTESVDDLEEWCARNPTPDEDSLDES